MTRKRRHAERWGRWAEHLACLLLMLKGYQLLDRRVRMPAGELDIVARQGQFLVIVEVKARRSLDEARDAITPIQRSRIERAAAQYRSRRKVLLPLSIRYDQMLFAPGRWPRHDRAAWTPESRDAQDWL